MTPELIHSGNPVEELSPAGEKEIEVMLEQARGELLHLYDVDQQKVRDHYQQFSSCSPMDNPWTACVLPAVMECARTKISIYFGNIVRRPIH